MSEWCELCRDHFDRDHFVEPWTSPVDGEVYSDGAHGIGPEYGPYGELLWKERELERVEDALLVYFMGPHGIPNPMSRDQAEAIVTAAGQRALERERQSVDRPPRLIQAVIRQPYQEILIDHGHLVADYIMRPWGRELQWPPLEMPGD